MNQAMVGVQGFKAMWHAQFQKYRLSHQHSHMAASAKNKRPRTKEESVGGDSKMD